MHGKRARIALIKKLRREQLALFQHFKKKPTPEEIYQYWSEKNPTPNPSSRLAAAKLILIGWLYGE